MDLNVSVFAFIEQLHGFECSLSGRDRIWRVLFPDDRQRWHCLNVSEYEKTFYLSHVNGEVEALAAGPGKQLRVVRGLSMPAEISEWERAHLAEHWQPLLTAAGKWLGTVKRDWIKVNKRIWAEYPLEDRYGIVPNAIVRDSLPDVYRIDLELGKRRTRKLVRLLEEGFFVRRENTERETMTANDFFEYCRIAYVAAKRKDETVDESLSGRDMYARYADGRHEGLLDIDPESEEEFADWIDHKHPKRGGGGHPWEIKRGGNTTHIDLAVYRPSPYRKEGFKVELRGESIGRMVETMKMVLAINAAGHPITIADPEGVRKRLLAQDNIGLVPQCGTLHRANQRFPKHQDVFDVLHYRDLGRYKRRALPFITWEPLPILRPRF